jgi:hypothetical protein
MRALYTTEKPPRSQLRVKKFGPFEDRLFLWRVSNGGVRIEGHDRCELMPE